MHVRLSYVTADPALLADATKFIEHESRPIIEDRPGSLGMALRVNEPLGVALVDSFWVSGDAMRESDRTALATRDEAVRRGRGTVSVEHYRVASFSRLAAPKEGAGVRLTRADVEPPGVEDAIAAYEDIAIPWLTETDGFCCAMLYVDPRTGRSVQLTEWRDEKTLADSRGVAAAIRVDVTAATSSQIRALEEYRLVFSSARPT